MPESPERTLKSKGKYAHLAPFLEGIAHEFRNPMQGIMASLGVLRSRLEGDRSIMPFVEMIQKDTVRITDLIDQMLWLTRAVQMDQRKHHLSKLVEESIRNLGEVVKSRNASTSLSLKGELPPLHVDSQALGIAFSTLIQNALESRETGVEVKVEISGDGLWQRVRIQDNGEGITRENLSRVMVPFFSTKPKRAGLGLCLADHIVDAHGGKIRIKSIEGQGTEITLDLPVTE